MAIFIARGSQKSQRPHQVLWLITICRYYQLAPGIVVFSRHSLVIVVVCVPCVMFPKISKFYIVRVVLTVILGMLLVKVSRHQCQRGPWCVRRTPKRQPSSQHGCCSLLSIARGVTKPVCVTGFVQPVRKCVPIVDWGT